MVTTLEHTVRQDSESLDLITDFFQLVETPPPLAESQAKTEPTPGYFAETTSWLRDLGSTTNFSEISMVYELQDMVLTQQLACLCAAHSGTLTDFSSFFSLDSAPLPTLFPAFHDPQALETHAGHKHCQCGGHYKEGKCDSCGSLEHDD